MVKAGPFHESTVLVLGAGASTAYGFPLGVALKEFLAGNHNEMVMRAVKGRGCNDQTIRDFRDALRYGVHPTIDILLERKTSFREIGSYFIAGAISGHENHERLFPAKDWYARLFELLGLHDPSQPEPDVAIVTLNYDRSLEHFLAKNIDYNCPHEDVGKCHERRGRLKIVHAHGSLGPYPDVPYASVSKDQASLQRAAEAIRIVSDALDASLDFRSAQELLEKAKHIVFLGFGYNKQTLSALLTRVVAERTRFWGTAVRVDDDTKRSLQQTFKNRMIFGGNNQDCDAFLRDTVLKGASQ